MWQLCALEKKNGTYRLTNAPITVVNQFDQSKSQRVSESVVNFNLTLQTLNKNICCWFAGATVEQWAFSPEQLAG